MSRARRADDPGQRGARRPDRLRPEHDPAAAVLAPRQRDQTIDLHRLPDSNVRVTGHRDGDDIATRVSNAINWTCHNGKPVSRSTLG